MKTFLPRRLRAAVSYTFAALAACLPLDAGLRAQAQHAASIQYVLLTHGCADGLLDSASSRFDARRSAERAFPRARSPLLRRVLQRPDEAQPKSWPGVADSCIAFEESLPEPRFAGSLSGPNDPMWLGLSPWPDGQPSLTYLEADAYWAQGPPGPWEGPASLGMVDRWADSSHPDLQGRIQPRWMFDAADFHGTAVAGLMAANTDDGFGMASLLGGANGGPPDLQVHWDADPDRAVLELARAGVGVVAVPWISRCAFSPIQQALYQEVESLGTLVVAAAGNGPGSASCGSDGHGYAYPASLPGVLSISSVGHAHPYGMLDSAGNGYNWQDVHDLHPTDGLAQTHTHNDRVDLLAPGYGVWTTLPGAVHAQAWGSSFAVPLAAAAAVAVRRANPCLDPLATRGLLRASATAVDHLPENLPYAGLLGAGRLNLLQALELARGSSGVFIDSGQVAVWDGVHRIRDSLVVHGGGRWTLKGTLCMDSGAVVVLRPGARAELDSGRILGLNNARWQGIRVHGHADLEPPLKADVLLGHYPGGPDDHAVLAWNAGCSIADADTAIVALHGGLILGREGELRNNACAAVIRHYPFPWGGRLDNVAMRWEEGRAPDGEVLLRLRAVRDVAILGGLWEDARLPGQRPDKRIGLSAEWASFRLEARDCVPPLCTEPQGPLMRGLVRGVDAWSPIGAVAGTVAVRDVRFRSTVHPVRISGIAMPFLEGLDLEIPAAGRWLDSLPTGIYLDACPGAQVQDNTVHATGPLAYGLVLHASGGMPGRIVRNRWSGMRQAVVVLGRHGDADGGWQLDCNRFSDHGQAVHLAGRWGPMRRAIGDSTLSAFAGSGSSLALFAGSCDFGPLANRYTPAPDGGEWAQWQLGGASPVHRRFHADDTIYRPHGRPENRLRAHACAGHAAWPAHCTAPPPIPRSFMVDSLFTATLIRDQLGLSLDNGDTEFMLRAVADTGVGAWGLEVMLSEVGGYASDTLIMALLARYPDVSQPFFGEWLGMQAPLSRRVERTARRTFPVPVHPWLDSIQGLRAFSTRNAWRGDLQFWNDRSALWRTRLSDSFYRAGDQHAAIALLDHWPEEQARAWAAESQWPRADSMYRQWSNALEGDAPAAVATWQRLMAHHAAGGTWLPWTDAAAAHLNSLAGTTGTSGSLARQLLRWGERGGAWTPWPHRIGAALSGPDSAFRRNAASALAQVETPTDLSVWPNPSTQGGWYVQGVPPGAVWSLWAMDGRVLSRGKLEPAAATLRGAALDRSWFLSAPASGQGPWLLAIQGPGATHRVLLMASP